jgi:hypothetical protein
MQETHLVIKIQEKGKRAIFGVMSLPASSAPAPVFAQQDIPETVKKAKCTIIGCCDKIEFAEWFADYHDRSVAQDEESKKLRARQKELRELKKQVPNGPSDE